MWLRLALKHTALIMIYFYQACWRTILGGACRFTPTCSEYAIDAFQSHSPWRALDLVGRRLCRCHPFGSSGWDPVPLHSKEKTPA